MDRWGVAILSGVLGGIGGGVAVRVLTPTPAAPPAASEAAPSRDVVEQLAEIRRLLDRPTAVAPSSGGAATPGLRAGAVPGGAPAGSDAAGGPIPTGALTSGDLQALAERAAEAALERREKKEKDASKPPAAARMPLSDIARELGLSSGQESDLRDIYRSRTDRYLKLFAAPDGDPEAIRRELLDAKGDPEAVEAVKVKYLPKFLSKLGDVAAIEAETQVRVNKALGSKENVAKYKKFTPEEKDPFGLDANVTVTSTDK